MEVVSLKEINGNDLIHSHQVLADFLFNLGLVALDRMLKSGFQVLHSFENVQDFLLTDTESSVGLGDSLDVLVLNRNVEASLVEI